jgi:sec-independent protein translocase protein TatA
MLGFDNPIHIAFILVLLLLVFGAKRLPEMGRSLGTGLRGFKESISGEHDPTAHLTTTPSAAPITVTQPIATPMVAEPTHVQVAQPSVASVVTPAVMAEPVITPEPVVTGEPVRERVPVWRV